VEQTDEGQEMEITPLLTSVENRGLRDVLWKKYFWGLADGWGRNKKASTTICTEIGFPGHDFGKIFFWWELKRAKSKPLASDSTPPGVPVLSVARFQKPSARLSGTATSCR